MSMFKQFDWQARTGLWWQNRQRGSKIFDLLYKLTLNVQQLTWTQIVWHIMIECLTFLLRVLDVATLNLGPKSSYRDWDVSWFYSFPPGKCWDNTLKQAVATSLPFNIRKWPPLGAGTYGREFKEYHRTNSQHFWHRRALSIENELISLFDNTLNDNSALPYSQSVRNVFTERTYKNTI